MAMNLMAIVTSLHLQLKLLSKLTKLHVHGGNFVNTHTRIQYYTEELL